MLVLDPGAVRRLVRDGHRHRAVGPAVLLADDQLLRDVDQTPRQVAGVGRPQRGVGQALAGAVRRDEVLEHRQALAEVRLDRARDDLALRVGHQATHARDLADLHDVPPGSRVGHHVDRVGLSELRLHRDLDLVGRLGPDRDQLLAALVVGDDALAVLHLDLLGLLLVLVQDLRPCPKGWSRPRSRSSRRPASRSGTRGSSDRRGSARPAPGRSGARLVDQAAHVALQHRAVDGTRSPSPGTPG